ncbi:class I SAM-dependent methyltransferase [candidate division KSB1 bacterium]|nr:class I SAM-dependent methyltransferase [candidate division KSB1 bacterium]
MQQQSSDKNFKEMLVDQFNLFLQHFSMETDMDPQIFNKGIYYIIERRYEVLSLTGEPSYINDILAYCLMLTKQFIYQYNQFVQLDKNDEMDITVLHRTLFRTIEDVLTREQNLEQMESGLIFVIREFLKEIKNLFYRIFKDDQTKELFKQTLNYQYSPSLQLDVLGINVEKLEQPVLDLGCGFSGKLVEYLNDKNIKTVGLDREVEDRANLIKADWLNFQLPAGLWGTIISHLAFSNHFIFNHLYRNGSPEKYARIYMNILASLKRGGSFYYAPGLPFIEEHLPSGRYAILKSELAEKLPDREKFHGVVNADYFYGVKVTKL